MEELDTSSARRGVPLKLCEPKCPCHNCQWVRFNENLCH